MKKNSPFFVTIFGLTGYVMTNQTPLLLNQDETIIRFFDSNITIDEMSKKLGVSKTTLSRRIRELGLKRNKIYRQKLADKKNLILSYEQEGLTYLEIAKKLCVHPTNLLIARKKFGIFKEDSLLAKKIIIGREKNKGIAKRGCKNCCLDIYADEIISLLNKGFTKAAIAQKYKVSVATVFNFLNKNKINIKTKKKFEIKKTQLIRLYKQNFSIQEIAARLNCAVDTVKSGIAEFTLTRNSDVIKISSKLTKQEKLLKKLFNQGLSLAEIGKRLGSHEVSVGLKVKKLGLKRDFSSVKQPSLLDGKYNKIKKMLEDGHKQREIAQILGVAENTLIYHIKKGGLKRA